MSENEPASVVAETTEPSGPDKEFLMLLSNGIFDHSEIHSERNPDGWVYTIKASLNGDNLNLVIDLPDGADENLVRAKLYKARNNYLTPLPEV